MGDFSARVVNAWYGRSPWLWLLLPLSLLFYLIISSRRLAFRRGWAVSQSCGVPVIVVGNITVGGTGKTPTVIALIEYLCSQGYRPGVVSRGYGAHPPATPWLVSAEQTADNCGDEPLLIARRTGVPVAIDPQRPAACQYLVTHQGCDVIISDDGLQHYAMARDIEIVLLDGSRGLGNGKLLPMGPLREPASRLQYTNAVIINGQQGSIELPPSVAGISMSVMADAFVHIKSQDVMALNDWQGGRHVHAVAGIGNPQRFFHSLEQLGFELITHEFPDHHRFSPTDLQFDDDLPVLMTEKDAVKCQSLGLSDGYWYLRVSAELPASFFDNINLLMQQQR